MFGAFAPLPATIQAQLTEMDPAWPDLFKRAEDLSYAVEQMSSVSEFADLVRYEAKLREIIAQNVAQVLADAQSGDTWRIPTSLGNVLDITKRAYLGNPGLLANFERFMADFKRREAEGWVTMPPEPIRAQVIPEPAVALPAVVEAPLSNIATPEEVAIQDAAAALPSPVAPSPLAYLAVLGGGVWLLSKLFKSSAS